MKSLNTIFLLSLLVLAGCGEATVDEDQARAFIKLYGNSWGDEGNDLVQLEDGGYILVGTTTTLNEDTDVALVRTDRYGNEQWTQFFGGAGDDSGHSVKETGDGGFILAGSYEDTGLNEKNLYLVKTDGSGAKEWEVDTIGRGRGDQTAYCIQELADGYILTGSAVNVNNELSRIMVVRTDLNGAYFEDGNTWYKLGDAEGLGNRGSFIIKHPEQDRYIVVGTTSLEEAGLLNSNIIVISATSNGVGAPYKLFGGTGDDNGKSIKHIGGNDFILTGTLNEGPSSGIYLQKLIINENIITGVWEQTLSAPGRATGESVVVRDEGGFAVLGSSQISPTNSDFYLAITDANGELTTSANYGGSGNEYGASLIKTWDGFAMIGSTGIPEDDNRMIALIKVLNNGDFQ